MYRRAYVTCHTCKCEFFLEREALAANPDRACPNCGHRFDLVGMSSIGQALALLDEAATTVHFHLQAEHDLRCVHAVLRMPTEARPDLI
jgi:DNA-directed RNA polymerase subunit RPC12/RpoP